jgi:hypothetical protein
MATFKSFADFGAALERMDRDLHRERKQIALQMARKAQTIAESAASADLGGDPKFSGWRPRLDTQIKSVGDGALVSPTRSSAGPWTVAEKGRNQGNASGFAGPGINTRTGVTSRRSDGSVRRVRARRARRWNGHTEGKRTASTAIAKINRELPDIGDAEIVRVLKSHFDVS